MPTPKQFKHYQELYRRELLEHVAPFWLAHSLDRECGGYFNCLERDGTPFDTDKFAWMQAREVWTWATLYNDVEPRAEYLDAAHLGAEFLRAHAWDADGRVPFAWQRDGAPLLKPRDIFGEAFLALGMAAYAKAAGAPWAEEMSRRAFDLYLRLADLPETHDSAAYPGMRPVLVHGISFIKITLCQELRRHYHDARFEGVIGQALDTIMHKHVRPAQRALFEYVAPEGGPIPGAMGRLLNPGHALEALGFVLQEAGRCDDRPLVERACEVALWSLESGWDTHYGGMLYFTDAERAQNRKLEGDMKLWWVHVETMVTALLAYQLSGQTALWDWFERVHDWTWEHFRDPQYGEWYGYLRRDGAVSLSLKGSMWKCFFHLPRALMQLDKIMADLQGKRSAR